MQTMQRRSPLRIAGLLPLLVTLTVTIAGCHPGIRWRYGLYQDAQADGQTQGKLTFVYLRSFASVDCTDFEEQVLEQPPVLDATAEMVCVPLDVLFEFDRNLAEGWGLPEVPAFAIVAPDGSVLESACGDISADELLAAIECAQRRLAATTQPDIEPAASP